MTPTLVAKFRAMVLWKQQQIAAFVRRLSTLTDADGQSVLHNSLVWISSEIADGNRHNHDDKPILLAGQLGGLVTTDRFVQFPTSRNYANVKTYGDFFITLASLFGVNMTTYRRRREGGDPMAQLVSQLRPSAATCSALALFVFALAGCTAEIGGPPGAGVGGSGATSGSGGATAGSGNGSGTGATTGGGGTGTGGTGTGGTGAGGPIDPDAPTPPAPVNPGMVTARRLNRVEYNNTVRDLLGTALRPADTFQADAASAGYDTVGAALSLSPTAVRDYEDAAYKLVDDLLADTARRARVVTCNVAAQGETCMRTILEGFARRAYRRPATAAEVDALLGPFRAAPTLGATPALGLRYSLAAVLINQHFLFKLEIDPDPASATPRRLTDHEMATRLSYALWSTMPDDALFAAADAGMLQTDAGLTAQIDRMLADPRAAALSENFAGQWLHFRELDHEPDVRAFPSYTPALYTSMKQEAQRFFADFLSSEAPLGQLLSARFTYVDSALAGHYGLPVMTGMAPGQMWRADTSGVPRSGILTLGAVLTATSMTTRTSPVKRGEFVLKHLLCETVTPPPPDVIGIPDVIDPSQPLTMRQRMEQHRNNDACIGCHVEMDQLGFGLETYDAIGAYRTTEPNGLPVDAAGELPDGSRFTGAMELATVLAGDSRFNNCVTRNLMTFALGRYLDQRDDPVWIAHLGGTTRDTGGKLGFLVRTLFMSEAFRSRQAVVVR